MELCVCVGHTPPVASCRVGSASTAATQASTHGTRELGRAFRISPHKNQTCLTGDVPAAFGSTLTEELRRTNSFGKRPCRVDARPRSEYYQADRRATAHTDHRQASAAVAAQDGSFKINAHTDYRQQTLKCT